MRNCYWTIRYRNGWLNNRCFYLRKDAIAEYLDSFQHGKWKGKSWRFFKRNHGVQVVRVLLTEITENASGGEK